MTTQALRFFPYFISQHLIHKCNNQGRPAVMYLHPWEFDTEMPKLELNFLSGIRHYYNLENNWKKLEQLLKDFEFTSVRDLLEIGKIY